MHVHLNRCPVHNFYYLQVILENFKRRSGISSLTSAQRQYKDLQRRMASIKPSRMVVRPKSKFRSMCFDLVINKHGSYSKFMSIVVILNMGKYRYIIIISKGYSLTMLPTIALFASEFYQQPEWLSSFQG